MLNYTFNEVVYSVDNGAVVIGLGVFFVVVFGWIFLDMEIKRRAWDECEVLPYPKRESVELGKGSVVVNYPVPVEGVVSKAVMCLSDWYMCPYCKHIWKSKRMFVNMCPKCKHRLK